MIKSYLYHEAANTKLLSLIISFFEKIEYESMAFDDSLFDNELLKIANRHTTLIKKRLKNIYNKLNAQLTQKEKSHFIANLKLSNEIEKICKRECVPLHINDLPQCIENEVKQFFSDLYTKIIVPKNTFYSKEYGTLQNHYNDFIKKNKYPFCPTCGLIQLQTPHEDIREEYDHYLPKESYPLSAINFYNLMPVCRKCNSPAVKGKKDILHETEGVLFFPYDQNHSGIEIYIKFEHLASKLEESIWHITYHTKENKKTEIESWKKIYKIDSRYNSYIKGNICLLYKSCREVLQKKELIPSNIVDTFSIMKQNVIETPVVKALLENPDLLQAEKEMKEYS